MNAVYKGLPRRVKIGPYTIKIKVTNDAAHPELTGCYGMMLPDSQWILLRDEITIEHALNVVMHELSHAINWVYGVDDESTEEQFVTQYTNGLLDLLLTNPKVLPWLNKTVRSVRAAAKEKDPD